MSTTESRPSETELPYVDPFDVARRGASDRVLSVVEASRDEPITVEEMKERTFSPKDILAIFDEAALVLDPEGTLTDKDIRVCAQLIQTEITDLSKSPEHIEFALQAALDVLATFIKIRMSKIELVIQEEE